MELNSRDTSTDIQQQWFVMRDLKRFNAKLPAYKQLSAAGFEVFTPMTTRIVRQGGKPQRIDVPYVSDLLFVRSCRKDLDPVVCKTETLQYRYVKGAPQCTPMVVAPAEMDRFIAAVGLSDDVHYYTPGEITPGMYGRSSRLVCEGALNGYECRLLKVRGARKKRVLIELPGILSAGVDIAPAYVELI